MSSETFTLYSSTASQWANVPHLALREKGFGQEEYMVKEIDLVLAENFDPQYLDVNPNGTIPSLVTPKLSSPLIDSREILQFIDNERASSGRLHPQDGAGLAHIERVIELVHEERMSTNLILLQARNSNEMHAKQSSLWKTFVDNRQHKLEWCFKDYPDRAFYPRKLKENTPLYQLYGSSDAGDAPHQSFYQETQEQYRVFAEGLDTLDELIKLPYIAGDSVTSADLHVVPWLAHAMWGAGVCKVEDFGPLEALIQFTVPDFKIGERIREWWSGMARRESFQAVYPVLH